MIWSPFLLLLTAPLAAFIASSLVAVCVLSSLPFFFFSGVPVLSRLDSSDFSVPLVGLSNLRGVSFILFCLSSFSVISIVSFLTLTLRLYRKDFRPSSRPILITDN